MISTPKPAPQTGYKNVGLPGYFTRYGVRYGARRALYMLNPLLGFRSYSARKQRYYEHIAHTVIPRYAQQAASVTQMPHFPQHPEALPNTIWIAWHDGFDMAPQLVRACRDSVYAHAAGRRIVELTKDNLGEYVRMPAHVQRALAAGTMPVAVFYDIVRYALLGHYGGTWIDATVLLTGSLDALLGERSFFAMRVDAVGSAAEYANWLLHAAAPEPIFRSAASILLRYWAHEKHLCEYLLGYIVLTHAIRQDARAAEIWAACPQAAPAEQMLQQLGERYTEERFASLTAASPVHKLSHKLPAATLNDPHNLLHFILGEHADAVPAGAVRAAADASGAAQASAVQAHTQLARAEFLGVRINNICFADVCRAVLHAEESGETLTMMSLNLDILTKLHRQPSFRAASEAFTLVLLDSTPLLKLARRQGIVVPEKLSGSDLLPRLAGFASQQGLGCFILGGAPGVPERAAEHLRQQHPGLNIVGALSPEFGFTADAAASARIARQVQESGADIVFVCLGAPKAELFIAQHLQKLGIPAIFSVGAAVDFSAGAKRRAPVWMQRAGLEWFFRFLQEPRRLFRRYFVESWQFVHIYLRYGRKAR